MALRSPNRQLPWLLIPAAWSSSRDDVAWATAAGERGIGLLDSLPEGFDSPGIVLAWPQVAVLALPPELPKALLNHPQALAGALEDRLLLPAGEIFAVAAPLAGGAAAACVERARLDLILAELKGRNIYPAIAVPEAWEAPADSSQDVVLTGTGAWTWTAAGLPLALDAWSPEKPPELLRFGLPDQRPLWICLSCEPQEISAGLGIGGTGRGLSEPRSGEFRSPVERMPSPTPTNGDFLKTVSGDMPVPNLQHWSSTLGREVAIGPAWDWLPKSASPAANLLRFEYAPQKPLAGKALGLARKTAWALAAIAALETGALAVDWARLTWQVEEARTEIAAQFRQALPGATTAEAPLTQARQALATIERRRGLWAADDFVPLATRALPLLAALPPDGLRSLAFEDGHLVLETTEPERHLDILRPLAERAGLGLRLSFEKRLLLGEEEIR